MSDVTLDAEGIRVDLIDTTGRERFGHPSWVIPFGGGRVEDAGVIVEIRPSVEMRPDRWRNYDEIEKLADAVERGGGFMWHGDEMWVGTDAVVGRDALKLLAALWKRAGAREADKDATDAAYRQGFAAAKRAISDAVEAVEDPDSDS